MSFLDAALTASSMVVVVIAGIYAGAGLNAPSQLDRRAELWFALAIWVGALIGALLDGNGAIGVVLGALVVSTLWSFLHFPKVMTLETPMPREGPLAAFAICLVTLVLLGVAIALDGGP